MVRPLLTEGTQLHDEVNIFNSLYIYSQVPYLRHILDDEVRTTRP